MAVGAADIEQKWERSDFSARMPGEAKKGDKVYDPYSPENNPNVKEGIKQNTSGKDATFQTQPRRSLFGRVLGKLGF